MSKDNNLLIYAGVGIGILFLLKRKAATTPGVLPVAPGAANNLAVQTPVSSSIIPTILAAVPTVIKAFTPTPDTTPTAPIQDTPPAATFDTPVLPTTLPGIPTGTTQAYAGTDSLEMMFQNADYPGSQLAGPGKMGCDQAGYYQLY